MNETRSKTLLTIKTDKKLKEDAQKTAELLGLPLGTIINALLLQFVRDKTITISYTEHLKNISE